jgi:hypothetical protein
VISQDYSRKKRQRGEGRVGNNDGVRVSFQSRSGGAWVVELGVEVDQVSANEGWDRRGQQPESVLMAVGTGECY